MREGGETLFKVSQLVSRVSSETVLRVDELTVNAGEHWLVYGKNGAGKSLLAAFLLGQLPLGRHRLWQSAKLGGRVANVSFDAQRQLSESEARHDISEYSDAAHDDGTRVASLLGMHQSPSEQMTDLINALGIEHLLERGVRYLSSGQFRRVMIARALSQEPVLLILDSPLDSIDAASAGAIQATLERWKGPGRTIIELSRSLDESLPGCTHMALVADCALVASGPFKDIHNSSLCRQLSGIVLPEPAQLPIESKDSKVSSSSFEVIRMRGVNASYGKQPVINDLDWVVQRGDQFLIEGPNGCGKSTLLSLLTGDNNFAYLQGGQPASSQPGLPEDLPGVWLFGQRWGQGQSVWAIKKHFGVVSNHLHLSYGKGWSVLEVVCSGLEDTVGLYGARKASQQRQAKAWLNAVHLSHLSEKSFERLSFGQQKLVLLARSLVKSPPLLILDEPLVGLDDYHRKLLLSLLSQVVAQSSVQLLYVSHTVGERPGFLNRRLSYIGEGRWESAELTPGQ